MKQNRLELVKRATELKIKTIRMHIPTGNTNYKDWFNFFSSRRNYSNKALREFIEREEERHARYLRVLTEDEGGD